ncbi:uncharacterized protein LAESUDRAFT_170913 [Laetiporus sulphureus 93-53]|uniref:C3H1-type domain-containing protein n=1 Tax=Laetiporus sulphureus 93-53 TaxID=1314785 RepID=A0A165HUN4_9APHY|nr:uncharacterized protein LAESUDRAFT_170913 [Laetiporus sulphureus 93-53]KZT12211.1 hypothetical protein LAESUDRAFT_170913 [Laetiporus sulphureus 93-53]
MTSLIMSFGNGPTVYEQKQGCKVADYVLKRHLHPTSRTEPGYNYPLSHTPLGRYCSYAHEYSPVCVSSPPYYMPSPIYFAPSPYPVWSPTDAAFPQYSNVMMPASPASAASDASSFDASSSEAASIHTEEASPISPMGFGGMHTVVDIVGHAYPPAPPFTSSTPNSASAFTQDRSELAGGRSPSSSSSNSRAQGQAHSYRSLYRTKPCKFYAANGSCVKGDRCNFIHESRVTTICNNAEGSLSVDDDAENNEISQRSALPVKPPSPLEECHKKNFYPVMWRVIGGGVMMGGQRKVCRDYLAGHCTEGDDCTYAHRNDREESPASCQGTTSRDDVDGEPNAREALSSPSPHAYTSTPPPHMPPTSRRGRIRKAKKLTIVPPSELTGEGLGYSAHRILYGDTLLDYDCESSEDSRAEPEDVGTAARELARPMSTPPGHISRDVKAVRLFPAESP